MKKGYHDLHCCMCGKVFSTVTHLGGKRRLKKCGYCQTGFHVCLECYEEPSK